MISVPVAPVIPKQPVEAARTRTGFSLVSDAVFKSEVEKAIIVIVHPSGALVQRNVVLQLDPFCRCHVRKRSVTIVVVEKIGVARPRCASGRHSSQTGRETRRYRSHPKLRSKYLW